MNADTKPVAAEPVAALASKARRARPRKSRSATKVERLVCRYCGSDDLAPSFKRRRDARCRAAKAPRPVVVTPSNDDVKDHFINKNGLSYAGSHVIIDLWEAKGLDDREKIETALIDAVNEAGATLLHIHLHKFEDGGGISGVAVLAESHISVHTWPEKGFAAFDVFMCGNAEPRKALDVFKRVFEPGRVVVGEHKRGVV